MKALCWQGKKKVQIQNMPDPSIINEQDAIIRVTATAICGSDLHIYNGVVSNMEHNDILGHEFMGEVVAKGKGVKHLKIGDKVVVPFTIACGQCYFCKNQLYSACDCSNPNMELARQQLGQAPAGRVIAIDCISERLRLAEDLGKAETINFEKEDVFDALMVMTKGKGPHSCIDAVGCEAHVGPTLDSIVDKIKQLAFLTNDRAHAFRECIHCCMKGGTVSVPGVYFGYLDNIPIGAAMNKGLSFKMGQTHVQKYLPKLLKKITDGEIDPSMIISHRFKLDEAPHGYEIFNEKQDECIKIVMTM